MAYLLPPFEADAFVSYSHGDPLGQGHMPLQQWTLALIQKVEREIQSSDPDFADVVLWRDDAIDPTRQLTPALRAKVAASGILIIVMSRHYLKSSWCGDE
ncbi:MAG TPA: toll/interleukin-1 receptor domain-containing protein, partial [Methylocystis sp.]|nr:toll/interleukin-1 receptor domain-containing protein [Methylocystis sp.]